MEKSKITFWPNRVGLAFVLLWSISIVATLVFSEWEIGKWWLFIPITVALYSIPFLITLGVVSIFRFIKRKRNK